MKAFEILEGWALHDFAFVAQKRLELRFVDFRSPSTLRKNRFASIIVELPSRFSFQRVEATDGRRPSLRTVDLINEGGKFSCAIELDRGQIFIEGAKLIHLTTAEKAHDGGPTI